MVFTTCSDFRDCVCQVRFLTIPHCLGWFLYTDFTSHSLTILSYRLFSSWMLCCIHHTYFWFICRTCVVVRRSFRWCSCYNCFIFFVMKTSSLFTLCAFDKRIDLEIHRFLFFLLINMKITATKKYNNLSLIFTFLINQKTDVAISLLLIDIDVNITLKNCNE